MRDWDIMSGGIRERVSPTKKWLGNGWKPTPTVPVPWLSGWAHRSLITIEEQSGATLEDYQILVELDNTNFDFNDAQSNGEDIRFTLGNHATLIDYWIAEWDKSNKSGKIWVEIPSIPASGTEEIYMYYGNPNASSASSGTNTFEFFDDFETGNLNKWDIVEVRWGVTTSPVKSGTYSAECDVTAFEQAGRCLRKNLGDWGNMVIELDFRINQWVGSGCHKGLIPGGSEVYPNVGYWGPGMINPNDGGGGVVDNKELKYRRGASPPYYHDYPNGKIIELNTWMHVAYYVDYDISKQNTYLDDFNLGEIDLKTYDGTIIDSSMYIERIKMQGSGGRTTGHDYLWLDNVFVRKYASPEPLISVT